MDATLLMAGRPSVNCWPGIPRHSPGRPMSRSCTWLPDGFCVGPATVTNLVCTIGEALVGHDRKHWTTYERFFYRAAWSLPEGVICSLCGWWCR